MNRQDRLSNISSSLLTHIPDWLPGFIATSTYSLWHETDFMKNTLTPDIYLLSFISFTAHLLKQTSLLTFSTLMVSLLYVNRIKRVSVLKGAHGSACRVLVVTLMIAMKQMVDTPYSNASWSRASNIPIFEVNRTEIEFLNKIQFDLHVDQSEYFDWVGKIERDVSLYRSTRIKLCRIPSPIEPLVIHRDCDTVEANS